MEFNSGFKGLNSFNMT